PGLSRSSRASLSTAEARASRLCQVTASRKAGSRATSWSRVDSSGAAKTSSPATGKPALRTAKSLHRAQSPVKATRGSSTRRAYRRRSATGFLRRVRPRPPRSRRTTCSGPHELLLVDRPDLDRAGKAQLPELGRDRESGVVVVRLDEDESAEVVLAVD